MVKYNFCILLILNGDNDKVMEIDWGLKHTCVVQYKIYPVKDYINNLEAWTTLLDGVTVTP